MRACMCVCTVCTFPYWRDVVADVVHVVLGNVDWLFVGQAINQSVSHSLHAYIHGLICVCLCMCIV